MPAELGHGALLFVFLQIVDLLLKYSLGLNRGLN